MTKAMNILYEIGDTHAEPPTQSLPVQLYLLHSQRIRYR